MPLSLTDAVRGSIKRLIQFANANRRDFHTADSTQQLESYSLNIDSELRVYYIHHVLPAQRVMRHLSLHSKGRLDDRLVEQLAMEFDLGPQSSWHVFNRTPMNVHIFKFDDQTSA
jgi:hypothetical protein